MLLQLAGDTANVADELALLLDASSVRDTTSSGSQARKRVRVAWTIKALANQPKVPGLVKKLETYRNELVLRVVVSLKLNANLHKAREDARFGTLETLTRRIAEDLLANTSYFTTGLGRLQEGQETESELARIRHEETIAAIATLQGTNATNLSSELTDRSLVDLSKIQHDVLDLLWFRFMTDRQEEISAPYKATFGWSHAARTGGGGTGSNHLASWLVQGTGIYWVNGKAGSGKSTFMKHMATDPQTATLLQEWAGEDTTLLCAQFFFWAAGTRLQKSQEGLLRTILHESLSRNPELIPVVFPTHSRQLSRRSLLVGEPSLAELKAAFSILMTQRVSSLHICLFIDGVDEYDGDHIELLEYLDKLVSARVKFVLSSRPTPSCVEAFAGCPSIRLQDFTRPDIVFFVVGSLLSKRSFAAMAAERLEEVGELFREIVDKASGVFLWVILVVKALRAAADNLDSIADLRTRVDELPADLDRLYADMLAKMDPVYRRQAAMLLQIMYQSTRIPSKKPMSALRLSFAIEGDSDVGVAIDAEMRPLTGEEKGRRCQAMQAMIRSRCCGLLETNAELHVAPSGRSPDSRGSLRERLITRSVYLRPSQQPVVSPTSRGLLEVVAMTGISADGELLPLVEGLRSTWLNGEDEGDDGEGHHNDGNHMVTEAGSLEVHFLHKSVIDFLEQPQVWETLDGFVGGLDFNAGRALAVASLRELKATPPELGMVLVEDNEPSHVWYTMKRALQECALVEESTGEAQEMVLDVLDEVMDYHWRCIGG